MGRLFVCIVSVAKKTRDGLWETGQARVWNKAIGIAINIEIDEIGEFGVHFGGSIGMHTKPVDLKEPAEPIASRRGVLGHRSMS